MLWRLRAKESSLHRHVILFGTLLKGQRMDQLMSHLLSSIASVWFMSQNRGPSILERPMDEPIQSQRSFRGHILVPTLRAYLVMPEAPPAAPEWWELESFPKIKRNQEFSMQTNIDSLATILQTALLLTVQALPGEIGLHHKLSQWSRLWAAVSARCCFPNLLLPSWNLSPSKSKKHVVIGMFMFFHCLQCRCFWVLVKKHHETGTFSRAEKSSQGMRVGARLPVPREKILSVSEPSFSPFWVTSHYSSFVLWCYGFLMLFWFDSSQFSPVSRCTLRYFFDTASEALCQSWESISTWLSIFWETNPLSICVFVLPDPCKDWCAWLCKVSSISRRHARDVHQLSRTCCMLSRMDTIEPQAITGCWMHRSLVSSNICIICIHLCGRVAEHLFVWQMDHGGPLEFASDPPSRTLKWSSSIGWNWTLCLAAPNLVTCFWYSKIPNILSSMCQLASPLSTLQVA